MTRTSERPRSAIARGASTLGAAVDRRGRTLLVALLVALAAMTVVLAARKPYWNDELFTYYISRLPGVGDIWSELATGVEQTPLSFYLATRASLEVFGDGTVAGRVPEMLGFLLMSVCIFGFVARRTSPLYGLVAVLFPVATIAYGYAYEARAYGLVLGFSAAALLCWQVAAEEGPRRRLAALGTAVSLATAVASHYYAILLVIPLLVGEAGRWRARGRADWLTLGSLAGAVVPLLAFAPLIREASDYSTTFWARPSWGSVLRFYPDSLLDRALPIAIAVVLVAGAFAGLRSPGGRAQRAALVRRLPRHELAALLTLLLLPLFAVVLGKLATGAYTERSALSALIGLAILIAVAAWCADGGVPIAGLALLAVLALFGLVRIVDRYHEATADANDQTAALHLLQRYRDADVPVVVSSPHDFFELSHRVARAGGPRLLYLADRRRALRYLGTDAVELGVVGMRDVAPLHTARYRAFLASHARFLVYGRGRPWDWVTSDLRARGMGMRVVARNPEDGTELLEVRGGRVRG